jgi:hypothetical protein
MWLSEQGAHQAERALACNHPTSVNTATYQISHNEKSVVSPKCLVVPLEERTLVELESRRNELVVLAMPTKYLGLERRSASETLLFDLSEGVSLGPERIMFKQEFVTKVFRAHELNLVTAGGCEIDAGLALEPRLRLFEMAGPSAELEPAESILDPAWGWLGPIGGAKVDQSEIDAICARLSDEIQSVA